MPHLRGFFSQLGDLGRGTFSSAKFTAKGLAEQLFCLAQRLNSWKGINNLSLHYTLSLLSARICVIFWSQDFTINENPQLSKLRPAWTLLMFQGDCCVSIPVESRQPQTTGWWPLQKPLNAFSDGRAVTLSSLWTKLWSKPDGHTVWKIPRLQADPLYFSE